MISMSKFVPIKHLKASSVIQTIGSPLTLKYYPITHPTKRKKFNTLFNT